VGSGIPGGLSQWDRAHPVLRRAAIITTSYAVITALVGLVIWMIPCATCTDAVAAMKGGRFAGELLNSVMLGTAAYFGMRGKTGAFVVALVLLSIQLALALILGLWFVSLIVGFFAYWAYVGTATCISLDRSASLYRALLTAPPPETVESPPPAWIPPRKYSPPH